MTTGRVTTALGALVLGFATATAVPALAQNAPATSTAPATSNAPATSAPAAPAAKSTMPGHHAMTHMAAKTYHHPMHAARTGSQNPNAQNAAVDQLNQESLQAAQAGKNFSPSGAKM